MTATWTQPRTWSVGELTTASLMNQHLRDELDWLKTPTESGVITFAADVAIASASMTDITGLTTGSMTLNGGGVDVWVRLTINASAASNCSFQVLVDGATAYLLTRHAPVASTNTSITLFKHIPALAAGSHTFKIQANISAGTLTIKGTTSAIGDPELYVREAGA
jgi:hypothetical protein